MRVDGLLESCLYASDLSLAKRFYSGVLNLPVIGEEPRRHVFFRCGATVLLVFDPENTQAVPEEGHAPPHGARGPAHVAFQVDEAAVEPWLRRLLDHGVAIEQDRRWPNGARSIYFRDPAGNSVELATPELWNLALE